MENRFLRFKDFEIRLMKWYNSIFKCDFLQCYIVFFKLVYFGYRKIKYRDFFIMLWEKYNLVFKNI